MRPQQPVPQSVPPAPFKASRGNFGDASRQSILDYYTSRSARASGLSDSWAYVQQLALPVGRVLFALIFIVSAPNHFKGTMLGYASQAGVPFASVVVPLGGIVCGLGALSVLLGYHARFGALLLVLFLMPVTWYMHDYWNVGDPMQRQMQFANFYKNLSLMGGALVLTQAGAGTLSVDNGMPSHRKA